jgi:hypothetical protein
MNRITLIFVSILFFAGIANGQGSVNLQWQNTTNSVQKDIEYNNGFLYSVGNTTNGVFISKTDTLGNVIWTNNYTGIANLENLTVDNSGSVYAVGSFSNSIFIGSSNLTSNGTKDILMIKCNANGNTVLAKNAGGSSIDDGVDIAVDYANNIYIIASTGQFIFANVQNASNRNISILKYNNLGNEIWFNWMYGGTNALCILPSSNYGATSLKYSKIDSTIVFSGYFDQEGLNYSINSYWNFVKNYNVWGGYDGFIIKLSNDGSLFNKKSIGSSNDNIIISDLAVHENGNIFYAMTQGFSLNGYLTNSWSTIDYYSNISNSILTYLSSSGNWGGWNPCGSAYMGGSTKKIFYNNNTVYGLLHQPELDCGNLNCSDSYALKINTTTSLQTYVSLDPTKGFYSVAGNNGSYYLGSNNSIGKSCEIGCTTNFSLNPALDKTYCSNPVLIGNPECFYVKGGNPAYNYSWSPSIGLSATNIAQPSVSGITSNMVYTLTVTDQMANVIYDTINVNIGLPSSGAVSNITICSSQLPFMWNSQYYYYASTFNQVLQNSSGCDSIATLNLTINSLPIVNIMPYTDTSICIGTSYIIYADSTYSSYLWTLNGNTVSITDSVAVNNGGLYILTCADSNNCSASDTVTITINPAPQPIIVQNNFVLNCTNVNATNYQWVLNNNTIGTNSNSLNITQNGTYSVVTTDSSGCIGFDTIVVLALGLNNYSTNHSIILYPNPTSGDFIIDYSLERNANINIKLLDITGKVIKEISKNENQQKGNHKKIINMKSLSISAGVYMIEFNDGISKTTQRILYKL